MNAGMRVVAGMNPTMPLADVGAHAARVEALGVDALHVPETIHDGLSVALLALEHTERIEVRTSVIVAFARSPMLVASTAWDLQRFSGGRFGLGLGSQVKGNIEQRFSVAWEPPVPRMRDYIESLRAIWHAFQTGEQLDHRSPSYSFTRLQDYFDPGPIDHPHVPVYLAAINEGMCALAGEQADGFVAHPTNSSPSVLRDQLRPDIARGADRVARSIDDLMIVAAPDLIAGSDAAALVEERERKRRLLSFLYSTPAYRRALDTLGYGEQASELHRLSRDQAWDEMVAVVDDGMLDALTITGTYAELGERLLDGYAGLADAVLVNPPEGDTADYEAMVAVLQRG